jgi:hypothetical protein
MTRNESKRDPIRELLENAGVRHEQVAPLSQKLRELLQAVDHSADEHSGKYVCEAAFRFEFERAWGG